MTLKLYFMKCPERKISQFILLFIDPTLDFNKNLICSSKQKIWQSFLKIYDLKGLEKRNFVAFV